MFPWGDLFSAKAATEPRRRPVFPLSACGSLSAQREFQGLAQRTLPTKFKLPKGQHGVHSAEAERVAQGGVDLHRTGRVGNIIQITSRSAKVTVI
jgi:hypothetical protein